MKQKSLFKGLVALTLSAAMLLCVTGCDDNTTVYQPNDTDLSSLSVTEPSPFYFGTKDRDVNGLVEVHDPSTFKDPNSEYYYCYSTDSTMSGNPNRGVGIQIRRSSNLTDWEYIGHALDDASVAEARVLPDGSYNTGFWAPSIAYVNGESPLHYSVSTSGAATSRIYLAVSSSPEGPFTNRGLVVDTWKNTSGSGPNGIDPYYVEDKDGKPYLVYGSFFGGIYIKELKEDGTAVDNDTSGLLRAYYGTRLAIRETNALDGPEGASIIYNEDTGYYYLFLSYGYLGDTYDIRVARSEEITGPYVDYQGNEMTASGVVTTGTKLAASYQFTASAPGGGDQPDVLDSWSWNGFIGPGHGEPFYDDTTGTWYFASHVRDGAETYKTVDNGQDTWYMHYLCIRELVWVDGWPTLSPEMVYPNEATGQTVSGSLLEGNWETLQFDSVQNDMVYSVHSKLGKYENGGGTATIGGEKGNYTYNESDGSLVISLDNGTTINAKVLPCWDFENWKVSMVFTGIDNNGITHWGKFC